MRQGLLLASIVWVAGTAGCGSSQDTAQKPYPTDVASASFQQQQVGDRATMRGDVDFVTMSTEGRLVVYADDQTQADAAIRAALERVADIAKKLNRYDPASELSAINAAAGNQAVDVSDTTGRAIEAARQMWRDSRGAFNPLVGRLVALWKQASESGVEPTSESIDEARSLLDMADLECERSGTGYRVRLQRTGMQLDLGGLAKGWAAQEAIAAARRQKGLRSILVMLGGDGTVWSEPGWARPWTVAVQDPRDSANRAILTKIELTDGSVVTSGNYYRYFEIGGRRLSHIIDPRTGRPTESMLVSATVIHPDGAAADALATACMVLGRDDSLALLGRTKGAEGLLLTASGDDLGRYETDGLAGYEIRR
ncbi:MAG: FAD:protein FMN transferase [Planctomycetes bacterium]|nr:FAD:protein FMN transferase [Planctomycetota bacterium]